MDKLNCALLVDDDSINNFINERLLKKLNIAHETKIVLNGEEAIKFITGRVEQGQPCPELILLDINMPVMDGFEFLQAYEKIHIPNKNSVVIVMLTTSTNPNDTERLNNSGVSGYINKPLTEQKLMDVMAKYFHWQV
ncbi:MAG TPA: response regulator [Cytophagaceae bacterium]